ncbi:CAP Gly-rich domain-containing protein [Limtongia smithiae]|uniref:CAP Gly-rich domain-containing protein n=1 Tax=Limtongia smithiae TaxID=1125753 RepID=UPI0034CE4E63
MADVPLVVTTTQITAERRISPSWTITELKIRLEPVTGVPASAQSLEVFVAHSQIPIRITAADEDTTTLAQVPGAPLDVPYARLHVSDTRPPGARENYTDVSAVEKFELTPEEYERRADTVLAWKKRNHFGRFNTSAVIPISDFVQTVARAGIAPGKRCRVLQPNERRGVVRFVGEVSELPAFAQLSPDDKDLWVGVEFDEPVGKNDGSVTVPGRQGPAKRYFSAKPNHGSFVRPDKVDVGDFPEIDIFADDDDDDDEI